jgi:hypothetical protein
VGLQVVVAWLEGKRAKLTSSGVCLGPLEAISAYDTALRYVRCLV